MWPYLFLAAEAPLIPKWLELLLLVFFGTVSTASGLLVAFLKREVSRIDKVVDEFPRLLTIVESIQRESVERIRIQEQLWSRVNFIDSDLKTHRDKCREIFVGKELLDQVMKFRDTQDSNLTQRVMDLSAAVESMRDRVEKLRSRLPPSPR